MNPALQDTLLQLFEHVQYDPDSLTLVTEANFKIQAGNQFQTQALALRKDGTPFPVEAYLTPFIYRGKPHTLSVARDITERVEAERQLCEHEEQYRSVFEATYDGLIISNLDGFFVEVNPAFCNMYGYSREELIGLHTSVLTAPISLPVLGDALKTIKAGKDFQTVGQSLRKDGTAFYVEGSGMSFTYKGKPHMLSVIRDVSERVQAQQLLSQRVEERTRELSSLLEISHVASA